MKFSVDTISKIVKIAGGITNPKQAIKMLLDKLEEKNPSVAGTIKTAINSGKNPIEFIKKSASRGEINISQLNDLKQYYGIATKLGLSKKIPNSAWVEVETAIKSASPQNNGGGFGF